MHNLLGTLEAIEEFVGDTHYHFKRYGEHLLADRIRNSIDDYEDLIKEVCYLGQDKLPPTSKEILQIAINKLPLPHESEIENFKEVATLLTDALSQIESLDESYLPVGSKNLIEDISQNLQQMYGLVWRLVTTSA